MAVNRLLYAGLLVLSAVFYFASMTWFSWLLLVLLLAAPLLSLLISLPAMLSCRLEASMAENVEQGENAGLHLRLGSWRFLPLPEVQIRLNLRTRDREKDLRYLSRLSRAEGVLNLPTEDCGYLAAEFRKGRVYDYLGLFCFPMRLPKLAPMAILPAERRPEPMPRVEQFLLQQTKPKPGGGAAEIHEHRSYRPGDPVKDIQWKLSLKSDELVVREALEPVSRRVVLALRTPRGTQNRALNLGNLRFLSRWLLDRGVPHEIVWMGGDTLCSHPVQSAEDVLAALRETCFAPENSAALPSPLPLRAEWLCPVGTEGGRTA